MNRLAQDLRDEQRRHDDGHRVRVSGDADVRLRGNHELLFTALCNATAAMEMVLDPDQTRQIEISAAANPAAKLAAITVCEEGLSLPQHWIDTAFEQPWPVEKGPTALALLRGAREIAKWHGGSLTLGSGPGGTRVRIDVPVS